MAFEIAKNVPIPAPHGTMYPWPDMEIGDSIVIEDARQADSAKNSARFFGYKHGKKFTSRKTKEGLRIWRVE